MPAAAYNEMVAYIRDAAIKRGISPDTAIRVAQSEALNVFDPTQPDRGGDEGSSFGPFQFHYAGLSKSMPNAGMGDDFTRATGLDARDPSTWRQQVDFALDHARRAGWKAWNGAANTGIGRWEGIKTPDMTTASGTARHPQNPQVGRTDAAAPAATAAATQQDLNDEYEALLASRPRQADAEMPSSLLADTMASSVSQRPDPGGITASAADQDAALQPIDLASAAMPEAPAVVRDQPAAPALADLFKVKDIGLANLTDPLSGQPRLLRTRRAYG